MIYSCIICFTYQQKIADMFHAFSFLHHGMLYGNQPRRFVGELIWKPNLSAWDLGLFAKVPLMHSNSWPKPDPKYPEIAAPRWHSLHTAGLAR